MGDFPIEERFPLDLRLDTGDEDEISGDVVDVDVDVDAVDDVDVAEVFDFRLGKCFHVSSSYELLNGTS